MKIKAVGKLRHHFHGDYSATIALGFESEEERDSAYSYITNISNSFQKSEKANHVMVGTFSSEELDKVKAAFEPLRIDPVCELFDCKRKCSTTYAPRTTPRPSGWS